MVLLRLLLALCGNWLSEVLETIYELVELLAPVDDFHLNMLNILRKLFNEGPSIFIHIAMEVWVSNERNGQP